MMTEQEFRRAVHDYNATTLTEAKTDAWAYKVQGIDVVIVDFGSLGYGLMLRRAAAAMMLPTIDPPTSEEVKAAGGVK